MKRATSLATGLLMAFTGCFLPGPYQTLTFLIVVGVTGEGSVAVDPEKSSYSNGEPVVLTATPTDGWSFTEWTGDAAGAGLA